MILGVAMGAKGTEPVEVSVARDLVEASLLRGMLRESGIEAMVVGENLGAVAGEVPPQLATPRIWVRASDAEIAHRLISQYRSGLPGGPAEVIGRDSAMAPSGPVDPFCYYCGEPVSADQPSCPACGQWLDWGEEDRDCESVGGDSAGAVASTLAGPRTLLPPDSGPQPLVHSIVADHVAILTLNHPEKRNPLSRETLSALETNLQLAGSDDSVRVVVIRAAGAAFSAGHDLRELVDASEQDHRSLFELCCRVMMLIRQMSKPVIAEVQGVATAAGCQLAATCDLVVASDQATFATPGVKIGLFCSTPAVAVSRAIPCKKAMEMLLTGDPISASDAERIGLVNRVVPAARLHDETMKLARRIVAACPGSLGLGKRTLYEQLELDLAAAYEHTAGVMVQNAQQAAAQEGMRAFLERRAPRWET